MVQDEFATFMSSLEKCPFVFLSIIELRESLTYFVY